MNKETDSLSPVNVLTDPIEEIIKTAGGRYAAKQAAAVIFASKQIANGMPRSDVEKFIKGIFGLPTRKQVGYALETARGLIQTKQ